MLEGRGGFLQCVEPAGKLNWKPWEDLAWPIFKQKQTLTAPIDGQWRFAMALPRRWHCLGQEHVLPPSGVFHPSRGLLRPDTTWLHEPEKYDVITYRIDSVYLERVEVIAYNLSVSMVEGTVNSQTPTINHHLTIRPRTNGPPHAAMLVNVPFSTVSWRHSQPILSKLHHLVRHDHAAESSLHHINGAITVPSELWQGQKESIMLRLTTSKETPANTKLVLDQVILKLMAVTEMSKRADTTGQRNAPLYEVGRFTRRVRRALELGDTQLELALDFGLDILQVRPDYLPSAETVTIVDRVSFNQRYTIDVLTIVHDQHTGQVHNLHGTHAVKVYGSFDGSSRHSAVNSIMCAGQEAYENLPPSYKESMQ